MADMQEVYDALRTAHKNGNQAQVKALTEYIEKQSLSSNDVATAAKATSAMPEPSQAPREPGWTHFGDAKDVTLGQAAGGVAGSAAAGAAMGLAAPRALTLLGRGVSAVAPALGPAAPAAYLLGTGLQAGGSVAGLVPPSVRMAGGGAGGAASGAVDVAAEKFGLPKGVALPASMLAGGVGQFGGELLSTSGKAAARAAMKMTSGNLAGAVGDAVSAVRPDKMLKDSAASSLQRKFFGEKLPGFVSGLEKTEHSDALQSMLRQSDPALRGLAPGVPASAAYRESYFNGITQAVQSGKPFSTSPEAKAFQSKLLDQVTLGNVSKSDAAELLQSLRADQSTRPGVLKAYAESIDNRIREWGKSQERGGHTGAAAIDPKISANVREDLRQALNSYAERQGLGQIERKYRETYTKEMIAEAKDKLPVYLEGFGKGKDFENFARNLKQDPQGKALLQQGVAQSLAQQAPQDVLRNFSKLEKMLKDSELLTLKEAAGLRAQAELVQQVSERGTRGMKGDAVQRWARTLMRTVAGKAGGAVGQSLGNAMREDSMQQQPAPQPQH